MTTDEQWRGDGAVLAAIGKELLGQPTSITVRISRQLAQAALAAWERDEVDVDDDGIDASVRGRAGTLALIGASIAENGPIDGEEVVVDLDAWFIGDALRAADEDGLL